MTNTLVHVRHLTHMHVSETSRDCDGLYEYDNIRRPYEGQTFAEMWSWYCVFEASSDCHRGWTAERGTDSQGMPTFYVGGPTDEGFHDEYAYGCDEDCDPKGYRYRDHTAESMGY